MGNTFVPSQKRRWDNIKGVSIRLYLDPEPQQRHRLTGKGVKKWMYDPSSKYKQKVKDHIMLAIADKKGFKPLEGNLVLNLTIYYQLVGRTKEGDFDNYAKAVCDAGNKVLYKDDIQIKTAHVDKVNVTNSEIKPGLSIKLFRLDP